MPSIQEAATPQQVTAVELLFCVKKENRATRLKLLGSLFAQVNNTFFCRFSFPRILCSISPRVGDIGIDVIGLFEQPAVAPGDGVVRMDKP